eukprot:EG_transcript_13911
MDLMTSSVDLLKGTTRDATDSMAQRIQELMMSEAIGNLNARLTEGDSEIVVQRAMIQSSGLLSNDLRPSRFDIQNQFLTPYHSRGFSTLSGHPYFAGTTISGAIYRNGIDAVARRTFWVSWIAVYVDLYKQSFGNRTLYASTLVMASSEQTVTMSSAYVNQLTAVPMIQLSSVTYPAAALSLPWYPNGWDTTLGFNPYSGQVQFSNWYWLAAQNDTWIQVSLSISAETLSEELKQQLSDTPGDRLVLFFRQPHGYMIAASHGKFYSHSDVDRRYINPLTNPPNISAYHLWNCLQSDDALIQQACQQLYSMYQSWPAIPELRQETSLGGQQYWVATGYSTASLQATAVMLKNRASVMGGIDAGNALVDRSVADKKGVTFVILGVISAVAV